MPAQGVAFDGKIDTGPVCQPHFLQLDIVGGELDLFFQRHHIVAGFCQYIAHDIGQLHYGRRRLLGLGGCEGIDIVQGIEEEMWVDLGFEKGQFRL